MNPFPKKRQPNPSEEGYILVAVIFMMAILILSLAIAVPRVRESIQRDREEETMQRGKQYIRAVQLYYRKFNAYPPNVDALVKTNNIRFLRKKYVDPTTGKDEWKSIQFGQNKTPQAMGFFGQPLAAANGAGIGPSGGNTGTTTGIGGTSSTTSSGLFNSSPTSSTDSGAGTTGQSGSAGTDANGNPTSGTGTTRNDRHLRLCIRLLQQSHRQRADLRRRRHHRLLTAESQTVPDDLQKEKPLQRVGVPLQPDDGSAKHGGRKHWRGRPACERNDDSHWQRHRHYTHCTNHPHDAYNAAAIKIARTPPDARKPVHQDGLSARFNPEAR